MQHVDLDYHMEQGTKSMRANRWVLEDKTISICTWQTFFLGLRACMPVGSPLRAQGVKPTLLRNHPTIKVDKLGK